MNAREIAREANRIRNELAQQFPNLAPKLVPIRFKVSARMTRTAGTAFPSKNLIKLSLAFFASEANFKKDFRNTVTHEIAHILVPPVRLPGRRKRDSHGFAWQMMHRQLGGTGERCHTLELAEGFANRRAVRMVDVPCCRCGKMIQMTQRRAAPYLEGIRHGSMGPGTGYGFHHIRCI